MVKYMPFNQNDINTNPPAGMIVLLIDAISCAYSRGESAAAYESILYSLLLIIIIISN